MIDNTSEVQWHAPDEILIIEDDRDTANLYQDYLKSHSTTLATSGKEALETISPSIDLILFDFDLPQMDGEKVLTQIENDEIDHSDPAIIIITTQEPTEEILKFSIEKYWQKPIYQDELHNLVRDIALQNLSQHLSKQLFQKRSKRNALSRNGRTETELYQELLNSCEQIESELETLYNRSLPGIKAEQYYFRPQMG